MATLTSAVTVALDDARQHPGKQIMLIARDGNHARRLLLELRNSLNDAERAVSTRSIELARVRLTYGSVIWVRSVTQRHYLRGTSLDLILLVDGAQLDQSAEEDARYSLLARQGVLGHI